MALSIARSKRKWWKNTRKSETREHESDDHQRQKRSEWNASGNTVFSVSESKEMERKLIGAVNVNTWIDARDRKSGLANWLTVSPLYPLLPFFLLFPFLSLSLDVSLSLHFRMPSGNCPLPFIFPPLLLSCLFPSSLRLIREIYPQSTLPVHRQSRNWTFDLAFGCQSGFLIWVVAIGRNPALLYSLRVSGRINRISLSQNYTA